MYFVQKRLWQKYTAASAKVRSGSLWQQIRKNLLLWPGSGEDCSQTAEPGNRICTAESGESDRNR